MTALQEYIGETAAENLQSQLPNNRVQVLQNEFNEDTNRISIKLKVHSSDMPELPFKQEPNAPSPGNGPTLQAHLNTLS